MDEKKEWKYCVVGNIVKTHIDDAGILRNGTPAYRGGAKVYLCGKYWKPSSEDITVIGLSRGKRFYVHTVPVKLIENVRCSRVYNPAILKLMDNWEFYDCWWQNTSGDKKAIEIFVEQWENMIEEREQRETDELSCQENSDPASELSALSEQVERMSITLSEEIYDLLSNGLPKTQEELTDLLFHRTTIDFRDLYELDLKRMWDYVDVGPDGFYDHYYDSFFETANSIQSVIARMHMICALRDDIKEMLRNDYGSEDRTGQYLVLHQLAVQIKNLDYSRHRLSKASKELTIAAEDKNQYSLFDDAKDEQLSSEAQIPQPEE